MHNPRDDLDGALRGAARGELDLRPGPIMTGTRAHLDVADEPGTGAGSVSAAPRTERLITAGPTSRTPQLRTNPRITDAANCLAKVDVSGVQRIISVRLLEKDVPELQGWVLVHSASPWRRSTRPRRY